MKKIISLLLSLAMLLTITSGLNLTAYADVQTGKCGDNVTYSLDTSTGVLTISGTGDMADYPDYNYSPFYQNTNIESVSIEDGVTSIGDYVFEGCKSLTNVTIPNSVTSIGYEAFNYCKSLTSITIPNSVTSIGSGAFSVCESLASVTIPDSVTSIGSGAFEYCTSLTSITIPNSVTSIGYMAFDNCTSLKSVTIPGSVRSIAGNAFCQCSSLLSIEVSDNNKNYSSFDGVLFNKDKTELITYPAGKPNDTYEIPNSVTSIGEWAFSECESLTSVTIPDSVTSIGSSAFYNTAYYSYVSNWDNGVLYISNCLIDTNCNFDSTTDYIIKDGTRIIADSAFSVCESLASVTIPNSVTSIGKEAFYNCASLTSIEISDDNKNYSSVDGVLFNKDKSELITYPAGKADSEYAIPNSVTSIGEWAFKYCESLTDITIPNSVTNIGDFAFDYCRSLKDVYYTGSQSDWKKISIGGWNGYLIDATFHYNWGVETPLVTNEDETSFTVYNSTAIIDSVNDVNLKLKSVNMNIAENSSQFDKKKVVKKNDIKGKEIKFTKDDFRDYIIPAKVTSDSKYLKSNSHNIYMTKDRKDGKPYVSSVYVQQLDKKNKPKKAYVDAQYDGATLIDGVNYNLVISAVTNGAKDVKYYLIQNDGNSKYKTEITNGVASKIDLASKVEDGKSLYAYVVCDGVASEPVSLKLEKKKLSNSLKNIMSSSTVNVLGGQSGKFKLSDSVPIIGGTEASLDFMKCPVGVEITGNKVKISVGFDIFGYSDSTDKDGDTDTKWLSFKDSCKGIQEATEETKDAYKKFQEFKKTKGLSEKGSSKKETYKTDFLGYLEGYITDAGGLQFTEVCGTVAAEFAYKIKSQFGPFGVPIFYAYVEAGAEAGATANAGRTVPDGDFPFEFDVTIHLTPKVKGGAVITASVTSDSNEVNIGDNNSSVLIEKHIHDWSEWTVETEPTCVDEGKKTRVCNTCTKQEKTVISPTGKHTYSKQVVLPTYDEQGYTIYTCEVCNYTYKDHYTAKLERPAEKPTVKPAEKPTEKPTAAPTNPTVSNSAVTLPQSANSQASNTGSATSARVQKPNKTSIKKSKAKKGSVELTWSKAKGVKGYEIQLATNKKFKKNKKTVTIKKRKTTKTTVKKLKAKKKYYVRIRTYKIVNGKKVYSSWSKVKSVKTK